MAVINIGDLFHDCSPGKTCKSVPLGFGDVIVPATARLLAKFKFGGTDKTDPSVTILANRDQVISGILFIVVTVCTGSNSHSVFDVVVTRN